MFVMSEVDAVSVVTTSIRIAVFMMMLMCSRIVASRPRSRIQHHGAMNGT